MGEGILDRDVAGTIANRAAECGTGLAASLPDDWLAEVMRRWDPRFRHVPVNRQEFGRRLLNGALTGTWAS